jgi:hypothetical protein
MSKAMDPCAQGRIRQLERVRDILHAPAFDDVAYGLGTAEDACLFGLFQERISGGQGVIGKVQCEGPHAGGLQNKVLQKYKHPTSPTWLPYYRSTAFPTQIFRKLLSDRPSGLWREEGSVFYRGNSDRSIYRCL